MCQMAVVRNTKCIWEIDNDRLEKYYATYLSSIILLFRATLAAATVLSVLITAGCTRGISTSLLD